ncbi:hypothetical protein INR49_011745 [Caranx melampygus]|nr:hypothetical protein INR49_011745 [Caranx melampygus]
MNFLKYNIKSVESLNVFYNVLLGNRRRVLKQFEVLVLAQRLVLTVFLMLDVSSHIWLCCLCLAELLAAPAAVCPAPSRGLRGAVGERQRNSTHCWKQVEWWQQPAVESLAELGLKSVERRMKGKEGEKD